MQVFKPGIDIRDYQRPIKKPLLLPQSSFSKLSSFQQLKPISAQSNHDSKCKDCNPKLCTYSSHIAHCNADDFQSNILGTAKQFCESFYHIFKSKEFGIDNYQCCFVESEDTSLKRYIPLAIRKKNNVPFQKKQHRFSCRLQSVVLIAKIENRLGRYTNCRLKHAELFFLEDASHLLKDAKNTTLTIYLKFTLCNFCGGNATIYPNGYLFNGKVDNRSCTLLMLQFVRKVLQPRNIKLIIRISTTYKCNWKYATRPDDILTVKNALEGVQMLLFEPGVELSALTKEDWIYISKFTTIQNNSTLLFTDARHKNDNGVNQFLYELRIKQAIYLFRVVEQFFEFIYFISIYFSK